MKMTSPLPESALKKAMSQACAEARKWLGATLPNPPVGATVLDAEGNILAVAAHKCAGEAHAEAALLELCAAQNLLPKIHTLCVTLEPCNHQGRTPPCTEAIIRTGIKHVVIGTRDPNPNVQGGGLEHLKQAGIDVTTGVQEEECCQLIHAFAYHATTGQPWITVKRAISRDGSMIPPPGQKTFTSQESLRLAHRLRKKTDAILTGSGTILADNPLFTVRHVADHPGKRRWLGILDRRGRVPDAYLKASHERGLDTLIYQDINVALEDLTRRGAEDILVEAGPALSQAILDSGLWMMSMTIHQGNPDRVETRLNPAANLPFTAENLEAFLPA
ncbi:MAG: bifunctional diaminohydroxyphosphoribosylaminopyrimidine deaminase/5-amino-6-(5-phosphoribosylamino)uracil reductase RibD [Alphaproteobacteria bacterium]|nr:bifunctional diaminohydroxyphosphoribosylaminopyrimidine deaminase/5-amino-6-(5-phosphoribosylamino)uracil reductase RibD [Alphaproteobacteria bacterium]